MQSIQPHTHEANATAVYHLSGSFGAYKVCLEWRINFKSAARHQNQMPDEVREKLKQNKKPKAARTQNPNPTEAKISRNLSAAKATYRKIN